MVHPFGQEGGAVVFSFVQADDLADAEVFKDINVAGSSVAIAMHGVARVNGTHESKELAWDDPIKITVLHLLVMLVLTGVECLEIVPSEFDSVLETFKAVQDGAFVLAGATAGISVRVQVGLVLLEMSEGLMGVHLENHNHKGAHQVG